MPTIDYRAKAGPGDHHVTVEHVMANLWHVAMEEVSTTSRPDNLNQQRTIHCYVEWTGVRFVAYFSHIEQANLGAWGPGARPMIYPFVMSRTNCAAVMGELIPAFFERWIDPVLYSWKDHADRIEAQDKSKSERTAEVMSQYALDHPEEFQALQDFMATIPDSMPDEPRRTSRIAGDESGEED